MIKVVQYDPLGDNSKIIPDLGRKIGQLQSYLILFDPVSNKVQITKNGLCQKRSKKSWIKENRVQWIPTIKKLV